MDKIQVRHLVMSGDPIQCSQDEYLDVRRYLQEFAGESIDNGQTIYAVIALNEVKRLDVTFKVVI